MGQRQGLRKWLSEYARETLVGITVFVSGVIGASDWFKSLWKALFESGISFLDWWRGDTAVANWRLILATVVFVAVPTAFFFLLKRRVMQLTDERDDAKQRAQAIEQENIRLSEELNNRSTPATKPVFEPDRFQGMVLRYFWEVDADTQLSAKEVSDHTTLQSNHAAAVLDDLLQQGLLSDVLTFQGRVFFLNAEGRKFVRKMVEEAEKTREWPTSETRPIVDHVKLGAAMTAASTRHSDHAVQQLLDRLTPQGIVGQLPRPPSSAVVVETQQFGSEPERPPSDSQELSGAPANTQVERFTLGILAGLPNAVLLNASEIRSRSPFSEAAVLGALEKLKARGLVIDQSDPGAGIHWQITARGRAMLK